MLNNPYYMPYAHAMAKLGLSEHNNQLQRRMQKYPAHFITEQGTTYISVVLFNALQEFNNALRYLLALQAKKGGSHEQ